MMEMAGFGGTWLWVDRDGEDYLDDLVGVGGGLKTSEERANAERSDGAATIDGRVVSVDRYEVWYFIQT